MFFIFLNLMFVVLPWQQTSTGAGRVIAFSPEKRLQNIIKLRSEHKPQIF